LKYMKLHKNLVYATPVIRPVREGVSKGEEDGRRLPALWEGHPPNGRKAVWGMARPQGV
jgi:hypothetical protein